MKDQLPNVRLVDFVERVQDLSGEDCLAEGIKFHSSNKAFIKNNPSVRIKLFQELWDSINQKRGYGWDENPWVWVIKFRKLDEMPGGVA